jgi:hypothetical protein
VSRDVVTAIWNWRAEQQPDGSRRREHQALRRAALVQASVMLVVAALLYVVLQRRLFAQLIAGIGVICLLLGLALPAAYAPVHRFGRWLGRAVGQLLLYLLLVPFFYLFMVPVSLVLKLQKRDPMHRRPLPAGLTYWITRRIASSPATYERQFLHEDRQARDLERPVGGALVQQEQEQP